MKKFQHLKFKHPAFGSPYTKIAQMTFSNKISISVSIRKNSTTYDLFISDPLIRVKTELVKEVAEAFITDEMIKLQGITLSI